MIRNRLSKQVDHCLNGIPLLQFMRTQFNLGLPVSIRLIEEGKVQVLNSLASKGKKIRVATPLSAGDVVQIERIRTDQDKRRTMQMIIPELAILYKDDNLLALNKPAGLPVQGGSKIIKSLEDVLHGSCRL
jgi:23S rRNA-/tRNA-specific pseudouridylate synthase